MSTCVNFKIAFNVPQHLTSCRNIVELSTIERLKMKKCDNCRRYRSSFKHNIASIINHLYHMLTIIKYFFVIVESKLDSILIQNLIMSLLDNVKANDENH